MPSNTANRPRRITTVAGTLFLIWFFFSPLLAAGTYFKWVSPEGFLPAFVPYLISIYALTGNPAYDLAQFCGGIYVKEKEEKPIDIGQVSFYKDSPWYTGVLYIVAAAGPPFLYKYIIGLAAFAPLVCAFLAGVILAGTALANWYPPFKKKVNYWLTQQDNELVAAAEAQPTLFALNAFFLNVGAIFIAVFCLSVFG
jgi:hypothetical protein